MRHRGWAIAVVVFFLLIVVGLLVVSNLNVSALPRPGRLETSLATRVRVWLIRRAASRPLPAGPANNAAAVSAGSGLFDMDCASCHGPDGRTPTPVGAAMYPRAADLGSPGVQRLSDREIFWVVKNGIRLSGMPGFAHINSDQEIWQLTYFVRTLSHAPKR